MDGLYVLEWKEKNIVMARYVVEFELQDELDAYEHCCLQGRLENEIRSFLGYYDSEDFNISIVKKD